MKLKGKAAAVRVFRPSQRGGGADDGTGDEFDPFSGGMKLTEPPPHRRRTAAAAAAPSSATSATAAEGGSGDSSSTTSSSSRSLTESERADLKREFDEVSNDVFA